MTRFFALTTRGLEAISQQEIASHSGITLSNINPETLYRKIAFDKRGNLGDLLALKTVDDVFLEIATWQSIDRPRTALQTLRDSSAALELWAFLDVIEQVRPIPGMTVFSVTASFIGKRNYTSDEIKLAVAEGITETHGWDYTPDVRESDLNVRLFILEETAYVGLRLGTHALHERPYKQAQRPGSLKPTVANAMLQIADLRAGDWLVDPCCGAGTILLEATHTIQRTGGDNDYEAVIATQENADHAGANLNVSQWDSRSLPLRSNSVDKIVTNLPWGKQITVDDALADFYHATCAEIQRVLKPDGCAVILTSLPDLLHLPDMHEIDSLNISLFGQNPTIVKYGYDA
ncbi:MAG: methyltransferase domain-containing protein [Aggregatilineales bacterium]